MGYLHPSVLRIEHLASALHELSVKVCLGWLRFLQPYVPLRMQLSVNVPYWETILSNKGRTVRPRM